MHSQCHSCWGPGDARSQGTSSFGIDQVLPECSALHKVITRMLGSLWKMKIRGYSSEKKCLQYQTSSRYGRNQTDVPIIVLTITGPWWLVWCLQYLCYQWVMDLDKSWYGKTDFEWYSWNYPQLPIGPPPLSCWMYFRKCIKIYLHFSIVSQTWDDTGSWNPSLWDTCACLSYVFNIIAADALVTQGARA